MITDIAILAYPVSGDYRKRFEAGLGMAPEYLKISELRRLPLGEMMKILRAPGVEHCFLPLEDGNSLVLLPVLKLLAVSSSAKKLIVVTPDLVRQRFHRLPALFEVAKLIIASIAGQWSLLTAKLKLAMLAKQSLPQLESPATSRILYLKTNLWYGVKAGGSVGHVAGVINAFNRAGYSVDVIASEKPAMLDIRTQFHPLKPLATYGLPSETNLFRFSLRLVKQIHRMGPVQPSFVYQRLSVADFSGPVLARRLKVPLIMEYNGSEAWIAKNWGTPLRYHGLAVKAEEICLDQACLIVVVSQVLKEELITRGIPSAKILYYPNCIDPALFEPSRFDEPSRMALRQRLAISNDAVVATFIGTFGEWHGIDFLAAAIRKMVDETEDWLKTRRFHFLLIGDGLKMGKVQEILKGERYQAYYTLTGLIPQNEAPAYLAASDILLSPHMPNPDGSRFFGSPTKLFEYMAMAKGIVASDLEQIGQILKNSLRTGELPEGPLDAQNQELAVLFKPGDPDDLIAGIRFLAEHESWRSHLGRNARREVLLKYTWDKHVAAILNQAGQIMPAHLRAEAGES